MYLFGLEGSGFIISLGLTLLISGAIMFYVLKRFHVLESSIIDNAKILQSFINKSQEQEINKNLASNIALESAIRQQNVINKKIEVSDDEKDSESENDIDESNPETDDSDDERIELVDNNILSQELVDSVKIIAINDFEELKTDKILDVNTIEDLGTIKLENNNKEEEEEDDEDDDEDDIKEINNQDVTDKKDEKLTNYSKFKISDLKELVTSKKLLDVNMDINKLKKVDLIKLLQNN